MGVREDTLDMLRKGLSPKEISRNRGVSLQTTLGYINELIGRGNIRRSDISFSLPKNVRDIIIETLNSKKHLSNPRYISEVIKKKGLHVDVEDVIVVINYGDARHALGDMYEDIRTIETHLHELMRSALEEEYGKGESKWWRKGIPLQIRKGCQERREEDDEPVKDPYCYTELLDLWQILDKQWNVLNKVLPEKVAANKQTLRTDIIRLNAIRRKVMHPVRGIAPSEEDFEFVRKFKEMIFKEEIKD